MLKSCVLLGLLLIPFSVYASVQDGSESMWSPLVLLLDEFLKSLYDFFVWLAAKIIIGLFLFSGWMIAFSWDVARSILDQLGVSELILHAWLAIPSEYAAILNFLKIPQAFNMVFSSIMTRYVMTYIPFTK